MTLICKASILFTQVHEEKANAAFAFLLWYVKKLIILTPQLC